MIVVEIAIVLFCIGLLLLFGPAILSLFLTACASIQPYSKGTVVYLSVAVVVTVIIDRLYRKSFITQGRVNKEDIVESRKARRRRFRLYTIASKTNVVVLVSVAIIWLHELFVKMNHQWIQIVQVNHEFIVALNYSGGILIALSVGMYFGAKKNEKKRK